MVVPLTRHGPSRVRRTSDFPTVTDPVPVRLEILGHRGVYRRRATVARGGRGGAVAIVAAGPRQADVVATVEAGARAAVRHLAVTRGVAGRPCRLLGRAIAVLGAVRPILAATVRGTCHRASAADTTTSRRAFVGVGTATRTGLARTGAGIVAVATRPRIPSHAQTRSRWFAPSAIQYVVAPIYIEATTGQRRACRGRHNVGLDSASGSDSRCTRVLRTPGRRPEHHINPVRRLAQNDLKAHPRGFIVKRRYVLPFHIVLPVGRGALRSITDSAGVGQVKVIPESVDGLVESARG